MKSLNPMTVFLIVIFTGLSLTGCLPGKLSDEDIEKISDKVALKVYPRISADLHKEFALLKGGNEFSVSLPNVTDPGSTKVEPPVTKPAESLTETKDEDDNFLPGPVNPSTATGMGDKEATPSPVTPSPLVVTLNNHALINREQFFDIYNHITKLFPISNLRTASPDEILKHIVKVELLAAEATVEDANRDINFLNSLHRPLTNAVITLLVSDIENGQEPLTDAVLEEYYNKTKVVYRTRPYISANLIEIDGLEYTPRGKTEKLKASDLLKKLRENPDSFSSVAREISISPTYQMDGKMDRIYPGDLDHEVNELLKKAEINKILDPIKVLNGNYVIFQVTARHEEATKPFELVKESIKMNLLQKRRENTIATLVEMSSKAIDSEFYPDLLDVEGKPEDVLARIENVIITREGFNKIIEMQKDQKEKFETPAEQKTLLEGLYQQNLFSTFAMKDPDYQKRHNVYLIFFQKEKLATFFLKSKLKDPTGISDEDIAKYYDENLELYKSPAIYVKTRHLIFTAKSESDEDLKEAKDRAIDCINKISKGSTFKELASTIADGDSGNKEAAPTHWFTAGSTTLGKEYFESVSDLKKGEITKNPVQVKNSFFVVKLEDKSDLTPFDLLKNTIANELAQKQQLEQYKNLLEDIETRQIIKVYPEAIATEEAKDSK